MKKIKITARKYEGDDLYSWAVFRSDYPDRPCYSGLGRNEIPYYKGLVQQIIDKEKNEE